MKIVIASDHAGLDLRRALAERLASLGHEVEDLGTHTRESCDYPHFAHAVTERVAGGSAERGVLVCGTGQGMAMAANRRPGVRAAVVADPFSASMAMAHNDARVLCLGARVVGEGVAFACLDAWLGATYEGGRHARRVAQIEAL